MLTSSAIKAHARTLGFDCAASRRRRRCPSWRDCTNGSPAASRRDVVPGTSRRRPRRHPAVPARRPVGHRHRHRLLHRRRRRAPDGGAAGAASRATRGARTITSCSPSGSRRWSPGCGRRAASRSSRAVRRQAPGAGARVRRLRRPRLDRQEHAVSSIRTSARGCCWPALRPAWISSPTGWWPISAARARCASTPVRPARSSTPRARRDALHLAI